MARAYDAPGYDVGAAPPKRAPATRWRELATWASLERAREGARGDASDGDGDGVAATTTDATRAFAVRRDLNALVRVCAFDGGDATSPWLLDCEVVTCAGREGARAREASGDALGATLTALAGSDVWRELGTNGERARTGECAMTSGGRLPARRIAHCVGPRYAEKYATAAEHALVHCYVSALTKAVDECKARTVACTPACDEKKGYPSDSAAMVMVRTIRRFLEKWSGKLDCVVVCANAAEMDDYRAALSVFFPRNDEERKISEEALKDKPGYNEYGEMILDERRLRIAGRLSSASDFTGGMNKTMGVSLDDSDATVVPAVSSVFMSMSIDPESRRQRVEENDGDVDANWAGALDRLAVGANEETGLTVSRDTRDVEDEQTRRANLLRRAESMDVSDVSDAKAIYLEKSRDYIGRRVVVVIAAFLERLIKSGEEQRLLAHVAKELRGVTDNPRGYVIVYHHTGGVYGAPPSLDFIRKLHVALGPQHRDTLKTVFVVHATAILKAAIWTMDMLQLESRLCNKVEYVETVCDLRDYVRLEGINEKLEIPAHVEEYERDLARNAQTSFW